HSTSLRAASNRGLVRGPELPPDVHRSFASLRMTRERENETPFAQNATLLRISTSRKRRETLRLRSGQAPSTPLSAGSFDSAQGKLLRLRSGQAPSTSITAGHEASTGTAGAKALMLSALTARLKSC